LWKPFAQQNHKNATYKMSGAEGANCYDLL
jgi:hypothetical protein